MKRLIIGGLTAGAIVLGITGVALAATTGGGRSAAHLAAGRPAATASGSQAGGAKTLPVAYNGIDGWHRGTVRPSVIYIGASDVFVRTPRWSRWTASSATAHGTLWVNTCTPTCSAGHYHRYPAVVTLGRVATHRGVSYFSRLGLSYRHGWQRHYSYRWGTLPSATIPGWNGGPSS